MKNNILPEKIEKNFNCTKCILNKSKRNYVLPEGNLNANFLLIGEAPNNEEDLLGKPFVGSYATILKGILGKAGIDLQNIMVSNCCFCRTPNNRQPTADELKMCYPYLLYLIQNMPNLKLVILLGASPLYSLLKLKRLTDKRGVLIKKDNITYLPTIHPNYVIKNMTYMELLEKDFIFANKYVNRDISEGEYKIIKTEMDLNLLLNDLRKNNIIALDLETSTKDDTSFSNFLYDDIIGISFSWKEKSGVYLPFIAEKTELWDSKIKEFIIKELKEILEHKDKKLILSNGHFDAQFLRHKFDININKFYFIEDKIKLNYYFDVMYAHHLIDENLPHDLDWLTRQFADLAFYKSELKLYNKVHKIKNYAEIPLDIIGKYGASDADGTFRLYQLFLKQLEYLKLDGLFFNLVMPLAVVLNETEYKGVKVDVDLLKSLDITYLHKIKEQESLIYKLAGEIFNINSRPQLRRILFEKLKLPIPTEKTETNLPSTEAKVLKKLAGKHDIINALLEYYKLTKLHSTYIVALLQKVDKNNRIHTYYKIDGTETGRLSSKSPNLQNIPADDNFRKIFIAENGYSFIISDYSQIELRVMAAFSKDPVMLDIFKKNLDIHRATAANIFSKKLEEVTDKERKIAKAINFGLIYGMSAEGLANNQDLIDSGVKLTKEEAEQFISKYFATFKKVKEFQTNLLAYVRATKTVKTLLGRIRHIEDINDDNAFKRSIAERSALNSPIQGTAAECTNLSAVKIFFEFVKNNIDGILVLTVHDELVYEVKNTDIDKACKIIYNTMKEVAETILNLPVEVDQCINNKWVEIKDKEQEDFLKVLNLPTDYLKQIKINYKEVLA